MKRIAMVLCGLLLLAGAGSVFASEVVRGFERGDRVSERLNAPGGQIAEQGTPPANQPGWQCPRAERRGENWQCPRAERRGENRQCPRAGRGMGRPGCPVNCPETTELPSGHVH